MADADVQNLLAEYNKLSNDDRTRFKGLIAQPSLGSQPSQIVVDYAWRAVISVFVVVFILASLAIIASIWIAPFAGAPGKLENMRIHPVKFEPSGIILFVFSHTPWTPSDLICIYHALAHEYGRRTTDEAIKRYFQEQQLPVSKQLCPTDKP